MRSVTGYSGGGAGMSRREREVGGGGGREWSIGRLVETSVAVHFSIREGDVVI